MSAATKTAWLLVAYLAATASLWAQGVEVRGRVQLETGPKTIVSGQGAVVWLAPSASQPSAVEDATPAGRYRLVQKGKRFIPHVLVVPVGSVVEFPNQDPFFHNVFSLFDGKRFDLGLYEAGTSRRVSFTAPGVSYIFCNIHPEMSAVVIATELPYYARSDNVGEFVIRGVPPGNYQLNVWHERCLPAALKRQVREVAIPAGGVSLGEIRLPESEDVLAKHQNLYGQDYPPANVGAGYGAP